MEKELLQSIWKVNVSDVVFKEERHLPGSRVCMHIS